MRLDTMCRIANAFPYCDDEMLISFFNYASDRLTDKDLTDIEKVKEVYSDFLDYVINSYNYCEIIEKAGGLTKFVEAVLNTSTSDPFATAGEVEAESLRVLVASLIPAPEDIVNFLVAEAAAGD